MAISKDNIVTYNMSGHIGKQVVFKKYEARTVVSKFPDMSKVVYNDNQLAERSRFQEAIVYAKSILADPIKKEEYKQKLEKGRTVYNAAIAEYMRKS